MRHGVVAKLLPPCIHSSINATSTVNIPTHHLLTFTITTTTAIATTALAFIRHISQHHSPLVHILPPSPQSPLPSCHSFTSPLVYTSTTSPPHHYTFTYNTHEDCSFTSPPQYHHHSSPPSHFHYHTFSATNHVTTTTTKPTFTCLSHFSRSFTSLPPRPLPLSHSLVTTQNDSRCQLHRALHDIQLTHALSTPCALNSLTAMFLHSPHAAVS